MNDIDEFNPLDVLATAATLQNNVTLKELTKKTAENNNELETVPSQKNMPESLGQNTTMVIQNSTQLVLPSENGKTMTVLQIDKQEVADHSYAFCQLNPDDNSFMARADMDCEPLYSPGQTDVDSSLIIQNPDCNSASPSCTTPPCAGAAQSSTPMMSPGAAHFTEDGCEAVLDSGAAAGDVIEEAVSEPIETSTIPMETHESDISSTDSCANNLVEVKLECDAASQAAINIEPILPIKSIISNSSGHAVPYGTEQISRTDIKSEPISPVKKSVVDIKSVVSSQLLHKTLPQTTTLKALEGKVVTLSVHNKPQQYLVAHKGSLKNKYIIEDDLSPVAKFGKTVPVSIPQMNNVIQIVNSSSNLTSSSSLPMYSAAGNLLEVLPLSDAGDKPVQFMSVSGESSGEESPAVILPPPLVIPDDDCSRSCTPLLSNEGRSSVDHRPSEEQSRPVTPVMQATSVASLPSDDPTKINLRIGPRAVVGGHTNTAPGTPYKLENTTQSSGMNMNIGSSIGTLSWESLGRAASPATISNSDGTYVKSEQSPGGQSLHESVSSSFMECIGGDSSEVVSESVKSVSLPASPTSTSRCTAYVKRRSRAQSLCNKTTNQMHPLVEHDYCVFKQFNAQVQSSILAMTDGNAKIEKKPSKKSKGLRTNRNATRSPLPDRTEKYEAVYTKPGRGRPKKKQEMYTYSSPMEVKEAKRKVLVRNQLTHHESVDSRLKNVVEKDELSPLRRSKRDDKSFVKITGSYQDDFVYYTTKNKRKARKEPTSRPISDLIPQPMHKSGVAASGVFDWYRDLSKLDKSSRFGVPETSSTPPLDNTDDSCSSMEVPPTAAAQPAPLKDSEMVDLVCELSAMSAPAETPAVPDDHLHSMAEQVRSMINNMDQNDIQSVLDSTGFDNMLPISTNAPLAAGSEVLEDLEDINDKDLLYNGMSNITSIISDLETPASIAPQSTATTSNVGLDNSVVYSEAQKPASTTLTQSFVNQTPPELTVVSMYWNDLPGLIISDRQYVRLVDIHKQVLPAKDTGILKKRCQMMDLDVANCSELQRDFLIRYANAAKSKSTVIVEKESAKTLISFYVEPRARLANAKSLDYPEYTGKVGHDLVYGSISGGITTEHMNTINGRARRKSTGLLDIDSDGNDRRSSRLKHKAGKYVEMLQGNVSWSGDVQEVSKRHKSVDIESDSAAEDFENRDVKHSEGLLEIRKLVARSRVRPLSKRDKRRLRRLRERMESKKQAHRHLLQHKRSKSGLRTTPSPHKSKLLDKHQHGNHTIVHQPPSEDDLTATTVNKPITMLHIIHRDNCSRHNQRGRSQQGILHVKLQKQKDSACVECVMCREMFTLNKFKRHQHPLYRPEELLHVSLPQRLELSNPSPSANESEQWLKCKNKYKDMQASSRTTNVHDSVLNSPVPIATEAVVVAPEHNELNDSGVVCEQMEVNTTDTTDCTVSKTEMSYTPTAPATPAPSTCPSAEQIRKRRTSGRSAERNVTTPKSPTPKTPTLKVSTPKPLATPGTGDADIRHSTRVRKRKQMDEYVYNSTATSPNGEVTTPMSKRARRSSSKEETNTTIAHIGDKTILIQRPARFPRRQRGSVGRAAGAGTD